MKAGRSLAELAAEIRRQSESKRDFLADTRELTLLNGSELHLSGQAEFGMRSLAHAQVAEHLSIPRGYYERLRRDHPTLLDENVNRLFRAEPSLRMVRTLDGQARAFLSNRYRRLDHEELAEAILPVLGEIPHVEFPSCEITDSRLYLKAVTPRVEAEVKPGDVVQAGVVISNSEVGLGALSVRPLVFRLICRNGAVVNEAVRRYHVGRQVDSDEAAHVFRDATLAADDRALWMKLADVVRAAVDETRFQAVVQRLRVSAESEPMQDPNQGVKELGRRLQLSEHEQGSVLHHLVLGGDLTRYGALNAVTRAAEEADDYDRATELETIGGAVLGMTEQEWVAVAGGAS